VEKWSNGVLEYWSGAIFSLLLSVSLTGHCFTDYWLLLGYTDEQELVPTNHFSLFTSPLTSPFY
jgi:hypothetical protein